MPDLVRPVPRPSWRERVGALFSVVSAARLATGAGAVLLVAVAAWWLLRPAAAPVESSLPRAASSASSAPSASSGGASGAPAASVPTSTTTAVPATVVAQAAGAVVRPGVYTLPAGARVVDLLAAAGGPAPEADVDAVATAAHLTDGQRVYLPVHGEAVPAPAPQAAAPGGGAPASAGPAGPSPEHPLDLNAADEAGLEGLPGVGPATAAAILAYRQQHGPFGAVDDLLAVPGIGPAKLAGFRDRVTV